MSRRDFGFNLLENGTYFNQSSRRGVDLNPNALMLKDYDQFDKSYQPMIDEEALIPHQQTLVKKLYGNNSLF